MSSGYKISEKEGAYYLTLQIVGWVDIFTRKVYRDIVIDSLRYCQKNKSLNLFAYVIMSNHIHMIAQSGKGNLSGFIRDFKSFTCKQFMNEIEKSGESRRDWMKMVFEYHGKYKPKQQYQFWTNSNHAVHIYSQKFIEEKVNYIHNNPVKSGLVENAEDYLCSSARNYAGKDAMLDVILLDLGTKTY